MVKGTPMTTASNELRSSITGTVLLPSDAGYDDARKIWNGMIDKKPAIIVRVANAQDVVRAVNFARGSGMALAVRGGGHNIAGTGLVDDGLVIDMSQMKKIEVDAKNRRAIAEAGVLLGELDAATQAHGLATPLGINSTTGIAGLTLGGGFGWISRKHGMTVDNLLSAEVVTAAGEIVTASPGSHPDLFWALRGGSGNFGVVTRFEYQLHPLGPDVLTGVIVYPFSEVRSVLKQYDEFHRKAPDELTVWTVLRQAPPLPFLPAEWHGKEAIIVPFLYAGDPKRGEELIAPVKKFGKPIGEFVGVQPYTAWQQTFDPMLTPGARNYWKSHNFSRIEDKMIDTVTDAIGKLPSFGCEIFFGAIGGATKRPPVSATAYAHRDTVYAMNVHARWDTPAEDDACIKWARDFFKASAPFASSGVYVNFLTEDEGDRVKAAYGPNYDRLAEIKKRYDPQNLFRVNMNIRA